MLSRHDVIEKALGLGFEDIGFTTAEPFDSQREVLEERSRDYAPLFELGLDLPGGVDPKNALPAAKSIIVLMENYFRTSFPRALEGIFGRCYLDDDRMTKDGLSIRVKEFRSYLRDHGVDSKVPFNISQRLCAARAGLGNFGKNCFFYAHRAARKSSWVLPIAVIVDFEFEPDEPTLEVGCPDWCRDACMAACPTGAIVAPRRMNPRRCISYLTYYGQGLTPRALREPMGTWVYGCDVCQNACPRNRPWLSQELPINKKAAAKVEDFALPNLLSMDIPYYQSKIWPHMFYQSPEETWRWKMNTARAMGNTRDDRYVPDLIEALEREEDERVLAMCAWSLGRIGGEAARVALESARKRAGGVVLEEVECALEGCE